MICGHRHTVINTKERNIRSVLIVFFPCSATLISQSVQFICYINSAPRTNLSQYNSNEVTWHMKKRLFTLLKSYDQQAVVSVPQVA